MCGIVGVVRRRARRTPPDPNAPAADLVEALAVLNSNAPTADRLGSTATLVSAVDSALRGAPGVRALLGAPTVSAVLEERLDDIWRQLDAIERDLDLGAAAAMGAAEIELVNSALIRARDAVWAVRHDRLRAAEAIAAFVPGSDPAIDAYVSIYVALSSLDRLEVRGRDSAGLHVFVRGHDLDLEAPDLRGLLVARTADPLFTSGSVRVAPNCLSFVYKAAAEIGELGDNTAKLRAAIRGDELLHFGIALELWGSGLAVAAHDAVLERMRAAGVRRAWLRVFTGNGRGRAFYEKLGWRPSGERSRSTFAPYPELLRYERDL